MDLNVTNTSTLLKQDRNNHINNNSINISNKSMNINNSINLNDNNKTKVFNKPQNKVKQVDSVSRSELMDYL